MIRTDHRHSHGSPIGAIFVKLAIAGVTHLIKKKLEASRAKRQAQDDLRRRSDWPPTASAMVSA